MTKVVNFAPRFLIRNNFDEPIQVRQARTNTMITIDSKESQPILSLYEDETGLFEINIRLFKTASDWSNGFSIARIGNVYIKLKRVGSEAEDLAKIETSIQNASIFIAISRQEGRWPIKFENTSDYDVTIMQEHAKNIYAIPRKSILEYAWDYPLIDYKRIVVQVGDKRQLIDPSHLGQRKPLKFPIPGQAHLGIIAIEVSAEGPTTVITMKPYLHGKSGYRDSISSQMDLREKNSVETEVQRSIQVRLEGLGISLISRKAEEIAYITIKSIGLVWTDTLEDQALAFSLKWLQVDNQIYGCSNPIFLYPTVLPKDEKEDYHPVLMMTLCKSKDESFGVEYYKWFTLLLQELSIDIDEDFLNALIDFSKFDDSPFSTTVEADTNADKMYDSRGQIAISTNQDDDKNIFFEKFFLHPMQFNVSFSRTASTTQDVRSRKKGIVSFIVDVFTMTMGNIHDAPIRLNALELEHPNISSAQLIGLMMRFYSQEILGQVKYLNCIILIFHLSLLTYLTVQIHRVIGAADFLGNPVGLFNNFASGVSDMFYEPLQGFEITRPQDFGIGVAKGASSLVKKTVFGLSDTLSKFTGSLGKGLAVITMDAKVKSLSTNEATFFNNQHLQFCLVPRETSSSQHVCFFYIF